VLRSNNPDGYDDLRGIDLESIDLAALEAIDLREQAKERRPWIPAVLIGVGACLLLWLPTSEFFASYNRGSSWLFPLTALCAAVVGVFGGRWLWRFAETAAKRADFRFRPHFPKAVRIPPGPIARSLALAGTIGGIALMWLAIDRQEAIGGGGSMNSLWWLATVGGLGVSILLGRWLFMQQHNPFEKRPKPKPIKLPAWLKWANLAALIGAGLFLGIGLPAITGGNDNAQFSFGGAGIVVGLGLAIWLVRRFDETEAHLKERRASKR